MPNLKLNIYYNYASFAYSTVISLVFMPLLHKALGSESFGLIGFYVLLTNLFSLLDLGLVTTVSRECAVHRNNSKSVGTLPHIFNLAKLFLHFVGGLVIFFFIISPDSLILDWFSTLHVSTKSVKDILLLIFLATIIRWVSGLYRGVINGFEQQVKTSGINLLTATLRFPFSYALILFSEDPLIIFFQLQIIIALSEYALLYWFAKKSIRQIKPLPFDSSDFKKLIYHIISFAISISLLTFITTVYTQIDKIFLMKILPLSQFGDFSLIQTATTGIVSLAGPIAIALIPRLTNLNSQENSVQLLKDYIKTQKILLTIMLPSCITCILLGPKILFAWTGNVQFSINMSTTFTLYCIGSVFYVMSTIPTHLKYASGEISFLIKYNMLLVFGYVPIAIVMGIKLGSVGVGFAWIAVNLLALLVSHTIILRGFFSNIFIKIIHRDIITASVVVCFTGCIIYLSMPETSSRFVSALQSLAFFSLTAAAAYFTLSSFRNRLII